MLIKETVERNCCEERDMVQYRGRVPKLDHDQMLNSAFCKHCGQLWTAEAYTDAAGGQDWRRVRWGGQ